MSGLSLANQTQGAIVPGAVELSESGGRALKLQTDTPHLVSMGGDRLSTSVTLHPIPQGRVTLGSGNGVDIPVQGTGVLALHCHIENSEGIVTIYPLSENLSIDGARITKPTRLYQGVMLTIGRSNYMRFNHPAEAKLMKSVLPNPRISMAPINFEPDNSYQAKFNKKPPAVPKKSPRESVSGSDSDDAPSSIKTKVSKFEFLAAQNFKKSISPKVFSSNLVTVNTPAKDVLGKAPPDLHTFSKNLPQSALNYVELNHNDKQIKADRAIFGRKSPQYVNVAMCESKSINNRVIIYENGCIPKNQNVNIDHNELNNKTSSCNKNINLARIKPPSPSYNRNSPGVHCRSITPNPISGNVKVEHRRSGSLGELSNIDGKNEAELRRNQAQQDRIKEQEIEKAEQARLEEILSMCAEYEKQSQCEKNKPIPNRIKTNGSLPRDKRQFGPSSPSYTSPPPSPLDVLHNELLKQNNHTYENVSVRRDNNVNYENLELKPRELNGELRGSERGSPYENVVLQPYPPSPRTRIKTFVTSNKDNSIKETTEIIENKFAILEAEQQLLYEAEQVLRQNHNNSKEALNSLETKSAKFILPLEDVDDYKKAENNKMTQSNSYRFDGTNSSGMGYKTEVNEARVQQLRREKREMLTVISKIKRQMAEIEMQEEELQREVDLERALITGEHKSKLLDLDKLELRKEKLEKRAQKIEDSMRDCQMKQDEDQKDCRRRLKLAQEHMAEIDEKLKQTQKCTPEYDRAFDLYLQAQEQLDNERKAFEDLEFHHLEGEAEWLATREELHREISDINRRIEHVKDQIQELEEQKVTTNKTNSSEYKTIEKQKIECLVRLEEIRGCLKGTENELLGYSNQESEQEISSDSDSDKSKELNRCITDLSCSVIVSNTKPPSEHTYNMSHSFNEKLLHEKSILEVGFAKKFPSQDDIDRISKVTSDAPINIDEGGNSSLNRKTIESLREIERNRQLHLHQQGSQVIEQERQRVQALKERVQKEVKSKWAQRRLECASVTSSGSDDTHNNSIPPNEDPNQKNEPKPSPVSDLDQSNQYSTRSEQDSADSPRPLSEISEMSLEVGGGTLNRKRNKPLMDKQRPLTRYLPIRGSDLNLREHIESAGHQVVLCPHVIIDSSTCKGFLHKKGSKLNGWSRRWFVFDRNKHTFTYYSDKSEKKARGGAYFQAIEEVYLDHLNSIKSPNAQLTFIVKTHERFYYLMAASPEAMRIWVDVIFTGAEGYREFESGT